MKDYTFKNHFSAVIEDLLKSIWGILALLFVYFFDYFKDISSDGISFNEIFIAILILSGVIIFFLIIFIVKWYKTEITLTKTSIIVDRKTVFRKSVEIKLENISTIDIGQNLIEKIFKTARVQLDINSISTANENDFKIILKYDDALEFRKYLLKLINKYELEEDVKITLESYDYSYDFKKIIRHVLLSYNPMLLIILLTTYIPLIMYNDGETSSYFIGIAIVVVPAIFGFINNLVKFYNLKLKKEEDKLLISYGLFTTKKYTLPYDKISGIKIYQPLFARIFKLYSVEIINVGYSDEENQVALLLPLANIEEINKRLKKLYPSVNNKVEIIDQCGNAIGAFLIDNIIWILLTCILGFISSIIVGYIVIILWIVATYLSFITKKFGFINDTLYITSGVFNKTTAIFNVNKIQLLKLSKNIMIEKLNLNKMTIGLQASLINVNHTTGYFDKELFADIIKRYEKN